MTTMRHNTTTCTGRNHKDYSRRSLEVEAEQKNRDGQRDHEYLPMDIFLDLRTIKEHFQYSSVRNQTSIHRAAAVLVR